MAYTAHNFKTKKQLREAVAVSDVIVQNDGMFPLKQGNVVIEGPHYPKPHTWYAGVDIVKDAEGNFIIPKGSKVR